jgi:hypothetical protein
VLIKYHGRNEIEVELGDYVYYKTVDGKVHEGTLLKVEHPVWPHNITYLSLLGGEGMKRINTNLIFRIKNLIKVRDL